MRNFGAQLPDLYVFINYVRVNVYVSQSAYGRTDLDRWVRMSGSLGTRDTTATGWVTVDARLVGVGRHRGSLLGRVRRARRRLPTRVPRLRRGGRGHATEEETTQKKHGRGGRQQDQGGLAGRFTFMTSF